MTERPFVVGEPNWRPLESVLPLDECGAWMWMATLHRDGRTIEQYKHIATRRYLNLDQDGEAWFIQYVAGACDPWCDVDHEHESYSEAFAEPISLDRALDWALS